jgi:replicative DNA helicase
MPTFNEPPYSQEAEEAVIGAVLINPNSFLTVASFLKADDFYLLRHSYVWQAMQRLHERKEPIDNITLGKELEDLGMLNEVGGHAFITQLISNTPTSVHAEVYGRLVERAAIRRKLIRASDEIRALALNEEMTIESVTTEAELKLFDVTDTQLKREFVSMNDAVNEYFDRIEHLMQSSTESIGLPSGFRDLDALLGGFQKSDLLMFAGRPGMGK